MDDHPKPNNGDGTEAAVSDYVAYIRNTRLKRATENGGGSPNLASPTRHAISESEGGSTDTNRRQQDVDTPKGTTMNKTQQTLTARVSSLESGQEAILASLATLQETLTVVAASVSGSAPAKTVAPKAPAKKAPAKKAATPKAPAQAKALCKSTRLAFIAAAKAQGLADFSNTSTKAIAGMCIEDPTLVPAGFRIGAGYAALLG